MFVAIVLFSFNCYFVAIIVIVLLLFSFLVVFCCYCFVVFIVCCCYVAVFMLLFCFVVVQETRQKMSLEMLGLMYRLNERDIEWDAVIPPE